jgi:serine/threonine protein kinase
MADEATSDLMTPERWRRVRELLDAALALSREEQSDFLAKAAADDPGLRQEVESLLALEAEADRLLPTGTPLAGVRVAEEAALPQSLGAYRIVGEAGHGGMGVVYKAERVDGQYTKQVAIKLLPALYSLTELETRFLRERQILARLEHPNVARLLDGGVAPDGRPYLVMEYVDGEPITECARKQGLDVAGRLRLFLDLCEAVAYAHRNFIVHRDLKPANILVDRDGRVKLLDFGLARILDTAAAHNDVTQTALPMMTPAYASPEQIRGEPITAASDVFSLGVVLYELLAGRRPFGAPGETISQVQRAVCETDPPPPSKAASPKDGVPKLPIAPDLDNIVLKAIAKDAAKRYPSVEAFAQDIRFYLEGRPVSARRAGFAYRTWKFVRRNRVPVALAALALIGTVTGLVAALRASQVAQAERARAERRFNDVRKLANSFLFEFHDAIANLKGATPARALVIKRAREYLASLSQDAHGDPGLLRELARSYVLLGDILGEMSFANLGDTRGSIESYQQAESLSRALVSVNPKDPLNRRGLMVVQQRMAMAYMKTGHPEEALRVLEPAGKTADELAAVAHPSEQVFVDLFIQYERLGMAYEKLGETAKHVANNRKLLEVALRLKQMNPTKDRWIRSLMLAYNHLAVALGTSEEASDLYRKAHEIAAARAANPNDGEAQTDLGIADVFEAGYRTKTGALDEALSLAQGAQVRLAKMAAADPENLEAAKEASDAWFTLGEVFLKRGKSADAARAFEESARLLEPGAAKDALDVELRASLASSYFGGGESREKLRGCPDALPWYRKSNAQWSTLTKQQALSPLYRPAAAKSEESFKRCSPDSRLPTP